MDETIRLPLEPALMEDLKQLAAQRGESIENVLGDLVRNYVREARRERIREESEHYQAMHARLKEEYLGQHVAIHEGRLVDHDPDPVALLRRVRERFGRTPVLITQVGGKPVREFMIRSPRLVQPE